MHINTQPFVTIMISTMISMIFFKGKGKRVKRVVEHEMICKWASVSPSLSFCKRMASKNKNVVIKRAPLLFKRKKSKRGKFRVPMKFKSFRCSAVILYNDMYDYMMTIPSHHQHHFSFTLFISFFFFPPLIISHRHPALYSYFSLLLTFHWPQFSFYLSHLAIQMEAQNFFAFFYRKAFLFYFYETSAALLATLRYKLSMIHHPWEQKATCHFFTLWDPSQYKPYRPDFFFFPPIFIKIILVNKTLFLLYSLSQREGHEHFIVLSFSVYNIVASGDSLLMLFSW